MRTITTMLLASAAILATPATAAVVFEQQNLGSGTTVHFAGGDDGTDGEVIGYVGASDTDPVVHVTSDEDITTTNTSGDPISDTSNGVVWVGAPSGTGIDNLTFTLDPGFTFTGIGFSVNKFPTTGRPTSLSVTLSGTGFTDTFTLFDEDSDPFGQSPDQKFYRALATDGYKFTSVTFSTSADVLGMGHLKIDGVAGPVPGVPEPSTWGMMLLGFGGVGMSVRARKRRTALPVVAN